MAGGGQDGGQGRAQLVGGDNGPIQDPGVALQGPGARLEALGTVIQITGQDGGGGGEGPSGGPLPGGGRRPGAGRQVGALDQGAPRQSPGVGQGPHPARAAGHRADHHARQSVPARHRRPPKAPRPGPGAQSGQGAGAVGGPLVGLGPQGPRPPHAVGPARGTDQGRLTQGAAVAGLHNHPGDLLPAPISQARGTSQLIEDHIQIHSTHPHTQSATGPIAETTERTQCSPAHTTPKHHRTEHTHQTPPRPQRTGTNMTAGSP